MMLPRTALGALLLVLLAGVALAQDPPRLPVPTAPVPSVPEPDPPGLIPFGHIQFRSEGRGDNSLGLRGTDDSDGENLVVELYADSIDGLYGVAFHIVYPADLLLFNFVAEGHFLSQDGDFDTQLMVHDDDLGRLVVSLTRLGPVQGRKLDSGGVLTIGFRALQAGAGALRFEHNQAFGSSGETRPAIDWFDGTFVPPAGQP